MESKGLKETKELLKGTELIGVNVAEALADGKINVGDVKELLDIIKDANVLIEAVKGIDQVDDEIKDLSEAEYMELGIAVFGMYKKIAAAKKGQA